MKYILFIGLLFLTACGAGRSNDYLRMYNIPAPTIENFTHCHSYGCKSRVLVSLPKGTENKIRALFKTPIENAEQERGKIIDAVQIFENDIGELAETKNDKRGTFRLYEEEDIKGLQQDCIDESTNTTIYISLLEQLGFLQFNKPVFPANRQPFLGGAPWWHQTAVIQDIETSERYAVDTWFRDNGERGFIVPIKEWKNGWMAPKP